MKKLFVLLAMTGMSAFTLAADEPQAWTYYAAANLTVGANAFAGASGIKTVTFLGPAVSEDAFGGILAGATASDTAKPVIVYVSEFQPTWLQTDYISPVDSSEEAYLPAGERVLGVYRAGVSAPSGKLSMGDKVAELEKAGT